MAKLSIKHTESETNSLHFHFFCINTSLNDYHFCWALNESVAVNLTRISDISLSETATQTFSTFRDTTSNPSLKYTLLAVKSENGLLIKDLVGFDFIFCIEGDICPEELEDLQKKISSIKNVLLITRLENKKTKPTTIADLRYMMEMIE